MTSPLQNLLRRTMAIAGAVLAFAFANASFAQSITLVGTTGNTCAFGSGGLSVSPNGALTITCSGVAPTPTGATFTMLAPAQLNINTTGNTQTTVTRSATPTGLGSLTVNYSVTGSGCVASSGAIPIADGDTTPQPISITTGATPGSCTVAITPPSGSIASPSVATINVIDPTAPVVAGCPTPDPNALAENVTFATAIPVLQASGIIGVVSVPLPTISTRASVRYIQSIGTTTANLMHTEFSVSKCKGAILTSTTNPAIAPQCYVASDNTTAVQLDIYTKPVFSWTSQATLGSRGCWAPATDGQYYLNFRWTYTGCAYGTCGFVMQWANGPY